MTGKAVGASPNGDNAESDAPPATVEELRAALDDILEDARRRAVYLVDAYAHAAGLSTSVDITEREARDIKPVKRLYCPRADLYELARDMMEEFRAERGRRPNTRELLGRMTALDSDHRPVSPRLDGETIHWTDWSGEARTTSLKAFKNQIARIPL